MPGTYYLVVTTPVGACSSLPATVVVTQDTAQPDARTQVLDTMTCTKTTITVHGLSNTSPVSYNWIGPNNYSVTNQQNINVTVDGGYTVMVKNTNNGCVSTAVAYVAKNVDAPTASAYVSGDLTCDIGTVNLTASSATPGVSYNWTGPAGFTASTVQNTSTTVGGLHTITTTHPRNGCTSTASVNVVIDRAEPGASISQSANSITCTTINSDLSGHSPSAGVNYRWSSPTVAISYPDVQNITVADSGTYVLTVKRAQNGCTSTASTKIAMDKTRPNASGVASPSAITCTNNVVNLNASSTSSPVSYKWVGPTGFGTKLTQNTTTNYSGGYILSVTNTNNGCITSKAVVVSKNVTLPTAVTASNTGDITCTAGSTINGFSNTPNAIFTWLDPNGATLTGATQNITTAGTYSLTVKHPTSGCTSITSTTVNQNVVKPSASASNDGAITCLKDSSLLTGSSTTSGVTYEWATSSTGTALSTQQSYKVGTPATYFLRVTNPANGCKSTTVTSVTKTVTPPANVMAGKSGALTCSVSSVQLNASTTTPSVTYQWSGPGFSSLSKDPSVSAIGDYHVTITNTTNGCTATASTTVTENKTLPGASITQPANITCAANYVTLHSSTVADSVTYLWSGPGTFNPTVSSPQTNVPGSYTVSITDAVNGCVSIASTTVGTDTLRPANVVALAIDSITCTKLKAKVRVSSSSSLVNYSWSGPLGAIATVNDTIDALSKGNYMVTVTGTNGCTSTASAYVTKDSIAPDIAAHVSDILNCVNSEVTVTGSSTTPNVTYLWSGPNIAAGTVTPNVTVQAIGDYKVTVTNPKNGCTNEATATVSQDKTMPATPSIDVSPAKLTCTVDTVTLRVTPVSGVEYQWSTSALPNSIISNRESAIVDSANTYRLKVTHTLSKCFVTTTKVVAIDTVHAQNVTAQSSQTITCLNQASNLTGNSNLTSNVSYHWSGPAKFRDTTLQMVSTRIPGLYNLAVTNTTNGCVTTKQVTVATDTIRPQDVTAASLDTMGCSYSVGRLVGSTSTQNVDAWWRYVANSDYDQQGLEASSFAEAPGLWMFEVTNNANGCKVAVPVTVIFDETPPTITFSPVSGSTVLHNSVNTISTLHKSNYTYTWLSDTWAIAGGSGTSSVTYTAGNTGTHSVFSVHVVDNRGCFNDASATISAVAVKSALAENGMDPFAEISDVALTAYPVPANGKVTVEFVSPEQTYASIDVFDTNGKLVNSLFAGNMLAKQRYTVTLNEKEDLQAGVYICILKTKTNTITKKVVIRP
jgi:hypothetical protein